MSGERNQDAKKFTRYSGIDPSEIFQPDFLEWVGQQAGELPATIDRHQLIGMATHLLYTPEEVRDLGKTFTGDFVGDDRTGLELAIKTTHGILFPRGEKGEELARRPELPVTESVGGMRERLDLRKAIGNLIRPFLR